MTVIWNYRFAEKNMKEKRTHSPALNQTQTQTHHHKFSIPATETQD